MVRRTFAQRRCVANIIGGYRSLGPGAWAEPAHAGPPAVRSLHGQSLHGADKARSTGSETTPAIAAPSRGARAAQTPRHPADAVCPGRHERSLYPLGGAGEPAVARALAMAAGWGGAGPGLSAERVRPRWARILRMTPGSSTVAIRRRRPPQRGHANTSISNARRISAAHAQ